MRRYEATAKSVKPLQLRHHNSLGATMAAAYFFGPIGLLLGPVVAALVLAWRSREVKAAA